LKKEQEKQPKNEEKKQSGEVSRRDFLVGAGTVVVGGAIGAGILSGCSGGGTTETIVSTVPTTKTVTTTVQGGTGGATATVTKTATTTVQGGTGGATVTTTKTVTNQGTGGAVEPALEPEQTFMQSMDFIGACDVKNGKIIRQRPIHYNDQYPNLKGWTVTARGASYTPPLKSLIGVQTMCNRKRVDSPNRILYPLQRVDWEPGGDPAKINAQNRGISKYKRITWDAAATIIASEMKRVGDKYGPSAISNVYSGGHSEGHSLPGSHGCQAALMLYYCLKQYGAPYTDMHGRATTSSGGQLGGRYVIGDDYEAGTGQMMDIANNSDMLVGWACNECHNWYSGLMKPTILHWYNKKIGIPVINIDPVVNKTAAIHSNKWIPIINNTDCALGAAIANVWFAENTYDKTYISTHAYGFDKWQAYVTGTGKDGIAKTPAWASAITGIPEYTIKALARTWASKTTSIIFGQKGGGANGRSIYADNTNRIQLYLLGMQGFGRAGVHQVSGYCGNQPSGAAGAFADVSGNSLISNAMTLDTGKRFSATDTNRQFIPMDDLYNAVVNPPVEWWYYDDAFNKRTYPLPGYSEIHFIWATSQSYTGSRSFGNSIRKGFQSPKIECHITQNMFLEDCMKYSDIILPISCMKELLDVKSSGDNCGISFINKPTGTPKGESKSDLEATLLVAQKLGFIDNIIKGYTDYKTYSEAKARAAYDGGSIKDLISWDDLNTKGYYAVDRDPATAATKPPYQLFYEDPVKNPLRTPSGKMEYESQLLMQNFPDDVERAPTATYVAGGPASAGWTHDEDPHGDRSTTYPIRMTSQTNDWLHHSYNVDIPWTRETRGYVLGFDGYSYSPVWINPVDAAARNIKSGDIIRIFNERGSVLGGAVVEERVMPQSIRMDKAGGDDQISPEINRGGNPNSINVAPPMHKHGFGLAAQYYLCQVEKVTGAMMDGWRAAYPVAFARDYDPQYGPLFSGWVEGGK